MITKNDRKYEITECRDYWKVNRAVSVGLTVCFNVDKGLCENAEALAAYIESNDIF